MTFGRWITSTVPSENSNCDIGQLLELVYLLEHLFVDCLTDSIGLLLVVCPKEHLDAFILLFIRKLVVDKPFEPSQVFSKSLRD